jgi:response regulator RpfG family c-di-GMP phosphodiesterase
MPYLNGVEALKMIKLRQPDAEIIMVTAVSNIKMTEECMRNGAFGYVTKPVDLDHLLKEIHAALEHRQKEIKEKREAKKNKIQAEELKSLSSLLNEELFNALKFPIELMGYSMRELSRHSRNVSWIGKKIAEKLNLPHIRLVELAGLYHDIGKLCLPVQMKKKNPKDWTRQERNIYDKFPEYGSDLVESHFHLKGLASIIYCQCENVDGSGFPNQLEGEEIPIEAKVIAVSNAFVEEKCKQIPGNIRLDYEKDKEIFKKLQPHSGTRFDPSILKALEEISIDYKNNPLIERKKNILDLRVGMVLSRDLLSDSGKLIFTSDTQLNEEEVQRILELHKIDPINEPAFLYPPKVS